MSKRPSEAFFGLGRFIPAAIRYIKGDTGAAATVAVGETTTLPAGSSATVQNVGDENNAVLKFGIPKGDKGDPGTSIPLPVSVANGGTGAATTAGARENLGAMAATATGVDIPAFPSPEAPSIEALITNVAQSIPFASAETPRMDGTGAAGTSQNYSREDHIHPTDTTRQATISDLATIRSGAAAGATAVQPAAMPASETWTFTVDDGQGGTTTVTKQVAVYAAQGAGA